MRIKVKFKGAVIEHSDTVNYKNRSDTILKIMYAMVIQVKELRK